MVMCAYDFDSANRVVATTLALRMKTPQHDHHDRRRNECCYRLQLSPSWVRPCAEVCAVTAGICRVYNSKPVSGAIVGSCRRASLVLIAAKKSVLGGTSTSMAVSNSHLVPVNWPRTASVSSAAKRTRRRPSVPPARRTHVATRWQANSVLGNVIVV